ncbi:protein angel homolog 2 isoform X2 [Mastacembelus armatus]|uniref:protein angel homolog 2 isoform X2 n=1 Tax=Mastacembelus armatus TaxID=205130 RepID=UPI000E45BB09|nr:protein angel homolog 2 isoform X2 [Mastacembelus armatus]
MFLSRLSSCSCSFLPCPRPAVCSARFRSSTASPNCPHVIPTTPPWWSVQGFPPWRPRLLCSHSSFTGRTLHPQNTNPGFFGSSWRSFCTSADLMMERPDRDREPPHKRRKSTEEKSSVEEKEGHRGGAARATGGKAKDGSYRREHQNLHPSSNTLPEPNHHFRDGSRAGKVISRESSRGKDGERTKTESQSRQRNDSTGQDETPNRGRSKHQQRVQTAGPWTQTSKSRSEQDIDSMHKPRPNPWFKDKGAEEQWDHGRPTTGPEDQQRHRGCGEVQWMGLHSKPCSTTHPHNPWQAADSTRQPPPPGTSPAVPQRHKTPPVKALQRHWEVCPACSPSPQPPERSTAFDFSVMSYNILSQELLQDNAYLYRHCDPRVLPWEHRLPNLLDEIKQHDADILCLQEVQEDHYVNQIKPALQALGYHCEYKKRTGRKPDGCAIVFKTSRFSLLSSNPVEFFRSGDALLDRDNVGLVVLLRPNDTVGQLDPSAFICVANTHLLYNPRRGDIKLAQLAILLAEITRLSRLPDGSTNPVLLCGDFNSTPGSPLYNFLITGCLNYGGLQVAMVSGQESSPRGQRLLTSPLWSQSLGINHQCQYESRRTETSSPEEGAISNLTVEDLATKAAAAFNRERIEHSLTLQSSYQHHLMPDGRPEITTFHSRTAITVDYILFTPEPIAHPSIPAARGLQLLGRLSLAGQSELEEVNGLPNHHQSSDHLLLLARFRLQC